MYNFTFYANSIYVSGDGSNRKVNENFPLSSIRIGVYEDAIIYFAPPQAEYDFLFKAIPSEINHGLGAAASAQDVMNWILSNTASSMSGTLPTYTASGANYIVPSGNSLILVDPGVTDVVILPNDPSVIGQQIIVKDNAGTADGAANLVTIQVAGGGTIDGDPGAYLDITSEALQLRCVAAGVYVAV